MKRLTALFCLLLITLTGCKIQSVPEYYASSAAGSDVQTVTVSVRCDIALAHQDQLKPGVAAALPADGALLPVTAVPWQTGMTAYDLLVAGLKTARMTFSHTGTGDSVYIQGIGPLYEYDGGDLSGWIFLVNGTKAEKSCGAVTLQPGDVVEWRYTFDLGRDITAPTDQTASFGIRNN